MNYKLLFEMELKNSIKLKSQIKELKAHNAQLESWLDNVRADREVLIHKERIRACKELENKKSGEFGTKLQPTIIINNYV